MNGMKPYEFQEKEMISCHDFAYRFPAMFPIEDEYGNEVTFEEFRESTGMVEIVREIKYITYFPHGDNKISLISMLLYVENKK